jgi:hypothetical protein
MKQPDFQKLFFDHFGRVPRRVVYSVRQDSNRYHDLVFLSSLIHDARFRASDAALHGKRLTISINRDCWELGFVKNTKGSELHVADSRMTISPVRSVEWRVSQGCKMDKTEFWIGSVWLEQDTNGDARDLVIDGHDWRCVVTLETEDIMIRLSDRETPFLYSTRGRRKANNGPNGTARKLAAR